MSTLTKFNDMEAREAAEQLVEEQIQNARDKRHKAERKALYEEFVKCIEPFNGKTIKKCKITLKFQDDKNTVKMSINGKVYRVFIAVTEYHRCNCSECHDGQSGHEGEYRHELNAYSLNKKGEKKEDYFSWYGNDAEDKENCFVSSFKALLEEYQSDLDWKKLKLDDLQDEES